MTFLSPNRVRISSIELSDCSQEMTISPPRRSDSGNYSDGISRVAGSPLFAIADVRSWSGQVDIGNYTDLIRSIKRYTLTASPDGDTLHIALEAECATAEDAQQLSSTANGMKMAPAPSLLSGAMK